MTKKILIVDDEPDILKFMLIRLEKTGYEVFSCTNGQDVLDMSRKIMPDLIMLDVYLPDINGDEVTKILKKDDELKHIPVILVSATIGSIGKRAEECGAEEYLVKPFEHEELIDKIEALLGKR